VALKPALHRGSKGRSRRAGPAHRLDVAKTRVLNMLKQRQQRGQAGLSNAEVREVTGYTRQQVNRLIHELESESVRMLGHGRGARYEFVGALPAKKTKSSR
jgi:ATP-dependent DNA helicase RecG